MQYETQETGISIDRGLDKKTSRERGFFMPAGMATIRQTSCHAGKTGKTLRRAIWQQVWEAGG